MRVESLAVSLSSNSHKLEFQFSHIEQDYSNAFLSLKHSDFELIHAQDLLGFKHMTSSAVFLYATLQLQDDKVMAFFSVIPATVMI